jgi:cobalt-precorrin-5B (C1)-methyltransferase
MWPESAEQKQPLRSGLTTGTCATACCVAASEMLFGGQAPQQVVVTLPKGKEVSLDIDSCEAVGDSLRASTIKDAGDDPDVTHRATVFVELRRVDDPGVHFIAGPGVGTVTRSGLALEVGEPAINDTPRRMMSEHLDRQAQRFDYRGGFEVSVGVVDGDKLALKTMNSRLGIIGGLSILGTTGIVRPYSCAAWIASIHQGIDVASANGVEHIAASTGNTSEAAIKTHYGMEEMALIEMGDFAGAVLKHLKKVPIDRLSICGGFGKLTKLADGHMDLNSRASSIDFAQMADLARELGADQAILDRIIDANTSMEVLEICRSVDLDIAEVICARAKLAAAKVVPPQVDVEIWAIDRKGRFIGHAEFDQAQFTRGESVS